MRALALLAFALLALTACVGDTDEPEQQPVEVKVEAKKKDEARPQFIGTNLASK